MLNYQPPAPPADRSEAQLHSLARAMKVLSEPNRLLLLEMLIRGVQCNCDLGERLGMAPNLVSHHLGVLREAGLVHAEHDPLDARWIYYSIEPSALGDLRETLARFLDADRIQPRLSTCGPRNPQTRGIALGPEEVDPS